MIVFYVNRGIFFTFEDVLEDESVGGLKRKVERSAQIPTHSQVILVSGGYEPGDNTSLLDCHAGFEENHPIYLFRKVDNDTPPMDSVSDELRDVRQLQERAASLMNVQPSYNTVRQRAQLSKDFSEHAAAQLGEIRRLVKEQHMMSQGWYVALANLDEKCERLRRRHQDFCAFWNQFLAQRGDYERLVDGFDEVLALLGRILLPDTLVGASAVSVSSAGLTASQAARVRDLHAAHPAGARVSLLDWLGSFDRRGSLADLVEKCRATLAKTDEEMAHKVNSELPDSLRLANESATEHRVVHGLETRLTHMSVFQGRAETRLRDQLELHASLTSNLERLDKERDASVVGELCKQHKRVLSTLAENHKKQTEGVLTALNAKNEFISNLQIRFVWLARIQHMLMKNETYLTVVFDCMREMRVYSEVLTQAKSAAPLYAQTLLEIVRRREFADRFERWASGVVALSNRVYREEVARRDEAVARLDKHFLVCLFRSMRQNPARFAARRPVNYDAELPAVTREDIDELRGRVPELAPLLQEDAAALAHTEGLLAPIGGAETARPATADLGTQTEAPAAEKKTAADRPRFSLGGEEVAELEGERSGEAQWAQEPPQPSVDASSPIPVPPRADRDSLLGESCTGGSPFVEMPRPQGEEEEVFSSALLNLDASDPTARKSEACQTEPAEWRPRLHADLSLLHAAVPELRQSLAAIGESTRADVAASRQDLVAIQEALAALEEAHRARLEAEMERARQELEAEREALAARAAEAADRTEQLRQEADEARAEAARLLQEQEAAAQTRQEQAVDEAQRRLILEHELVLEAERAARGKEVEARTAEVREMQRQLEWRQEKMASLTKEMELLDRASKAEKKLYETELARLRYDLDLLRSPERSSRRARRASESYHEMGDDLAHSIRRISIATVNTDSAEEAELLEVEEVGGWSKKDEATMEQQAERIAELEQMLAQRDGQIMKLQLTVDRLSQQAIRDRDYIRQLRGNSDATTRSVLGASPPSVAVSVSPPVLEQPGPISSFMLMTSSSPTPPGVPVPVTSPPKSVQMVQSATSTQASSMTESAISVSTAAAGEGPATPVTPGAVAAGSPNLSSSQRAVKLVLSQFRSGDRVLLLRNPSTGLWFMMSTDGWSYFVHSDCFGQLELDDSRFCTIAEFKSKERCLARKNKNRFLLAAGKYFFRIKARPLRAAHGQPWPGETPDAALVTEDPSQRSLDRGDGEASTED